MLPADTFNDIAWKPRIGFSANDASGDNANSKTIGTFNPIYPRLPYFAETSMLVPANVKDFRPVFSFHPREDVAVVLGYDMLSRVSSTDGLYGSGLSQYKNTAKVAGEALEPKFPPMCARHPVLSAYAPPRGRRCRPFRCAFHL